MNQHSQAMSTLAGAAACLIEQGPWEATLAVSDLLHDRGPRAAVAVNALVHAAEDVARHTGEAPAEVAQRWAVELARCEEVA